ncbi:MAG: MXAN_5187 C-terminal domain-containing protein [Sandaracinaceae bacterium]|nr:MXAN_5187 C-terminal domain-containing protein [Sandaracinaceae bacterium]
MDPAQYAERLHDAEVRLARLKSLYEQWFQGLERAEPQIPRKEFERLLEELRKNQPRNTALRFRCQQLIARYITYSNYWSRVTRQIEEGTYRRGEGRGRKSPSAAHATPWELEVEVALDEGLEEKDPELQALIDLLTKDPEAEIPAEWLEPKSSKSRDTRSSPKHPPSSPLPPQKEEQFTPPPRTQFSPHPTQALPPPPSFKATSPKAPPLPQPKAPPVPQPIDYRALYERYLEARRQNNERTDNVRFERFKEEVEQMAAKLRSKHGDNRYVDFEVVIHEGKASLKPRVR